MFRLAVPVILTYLGLMLMGMVDLLFVGRVNAPSMAAVGVGTSIFTWFMIFGIGLMAGLDYLVAFAEGASRPEDGHRSMMQSLIAVTALSVPMTAALFLIAHNLQWLGIHEEIIPFASSYLKILAPSLWSTLIFTGCRQYLTAKQVAIPALVILCLANVLNAALNYALVFGHFGAPTLGADGSAIATLVSRTVMMVAMFGYLLYWDRKNSQFFENLPFRFEADRMREFIRLGLPSALQMTFEVGVFALSTTLAARLTATAVAAHQIVLNIASMTFMVPLGLGASTAVLVGQALGRGDLHDASRKGWKGLAWGAGFMALSGLMLYGMAGPILSGFTQNAEVQALASRIILIAALFQLSDGVQVVATGALRGLGDTRSPMFANLLGHWGVGLPIGLVLCFWKEMGIFGLWIGLSLGLTVVASSLLWVWTKRIGELSQSR